MSSKKEFYIPRIDNSNDNFESKSNNNNRNDSKNTSFEKFASSYSGYNVKDENVFPYVRYRNNGAQYEDLKDKQYQKKYDDYKTEPVNPKDKYSPDRIPSYLRREEPAITKRNIMDLKGEKPTDKESYEKDRQNYGRYSDESVLGNDGSTNSKGIVFQETYQSNPAQIRVPSSKPTREERSTLVITKREPESSYQNPEQNRYQDSPREDNYGSRNYQQPARQSSYQEQTREDNYNSRNYQEAPRQSSYQEQVKTNGYQEESRNVYQSNENKYESYHQPSQKIENKKFFSTIEENNDEHFYDDIDLPLQSVKGEEPRELDSYQMDEYKKATESTIVKTPTKRRSRKYKFPPAEILKKTNHFQFSTSSETDFQRTAINSTLEEFRIGGRVVNEIKGPVVTQFEVKLDPGVKVDKIESISRNLQMNLASPSIRVEAPIPGKSTVGIEVPNVTKEIVTFGDLATKSFLNDGKPLNVILGKKINGESQYADIAEMPHALVAGGTGSGKTFCIYSIITSILYKATPEQVKLVLIDPKRNELMFFDSVPHLASPIITDSKLAAPALKWLVDEMERRYELFRLARKRTVDEYNDYVERVNDSSLCKLPHVVIVIDEFADLLSSAGDSFEANVQRIAQKARSAGIHLIIATQKPTVDVIKGTIKANIQTRIAFRVNQQNESFTILDHGGAEKLLGKGDMLYYRGGPDTRVQGAYITTEELEEVASYISSDDIEYMFTQDDLECEPELKEMDNDGEGEDELLVKVARHVVSTRKASVNQICRLFSIGFNRADNLMISLEEMGIVGEAIQGRPRTVLVDSDELERILNNM